MSFLNVVGLYALLALVPFIIIYLIRPRPAEKTIPSLMFLMRERTLARQRAFLQKLIRNIIFLLQLLALIGLCFAVAQPFVTTENDVTEKNTVLVIDVSGSSDAKYGSTTRFEQEIKEAKKYLKGRTSIITAGETASIIAEDAIKTDANAILSTIRPKATVSNIGDAMILAGDLLKKKDGNIVVLSDFISNAGSDVLVTKRSLESRGFPVSFVSVYSDVDNMGIVNMELDKHNTKVYVKNYNDEANTAKLQVIKNNNVVEEKSGNIMAGSMEIFSFQTQSGVSKIQLSPKDSFELDNDLYISAPESRTIDVWMITNLKDGDTFEQTEKKNYLKYDYLTNALIADKNIKLYIAKPPIIDQTSKLQKIDTIKPSIIILHEIKEDLLPGSYGDIKKRVERGTRLIITVQDDMSKIKFDDIMPVDMRKKGNKTDVKKLINNEFTKDVEFISLQQYYTAEAKQGAAVFVEAIADNSPIIAQLGNVIYYGILDSKSGFKTTTSYPIFWSSLVKSLIETENIADYNFRTGKIMVFSDDKKILKPSGYTRTNHLLMDEMGIYEFDGNEYAVNMLNEQESDVSKKTEVIEEEKEFETTRTKEKAKIYFEIPLIVIALLLMLTELLLLKFRGDI